MASRDSVLPGWKRFPGAKVFEGLDDALSNNEDSIRDMVDIVVNENDGISLSADRILKVMLGGVNRRLDRGES